MTRRPLLVAVVIVAVGVVAGSVGPGAAAPAATCARWAAPAGDDGGPGTQSRPLQTIAKLAASLAPGQVGCLVPGSVFTEHPVIGPAGTGAARITITTPAGPLAVLSNGLETTQGARYLTLSRVAVLGDKDGPAATLPANVILRGFSVAFTRSDVTGGELGRTCVLLDHARRAVVDRNNLHDCAPANALYSAGVVVSIAVNAQVTNNVVSGNPGDGIALGPDAQRSIVTRNLVVANQNGVYFGGGPKVASRDNRVERNIVVQSARYAVHGSFQGPPGTGNLVTLNCFHASGLASIAGTGYKAIANRIVNPRVVRTGSTYTVAKSSPCYAYRPAP